MHRHHEAIAHHPSQVIRELARQTRSSYEEARAVYEEELARTEQQARVKTYVAVIARKRAHEVLAKRHH